MTWTYSASTSTLDQVRFYLGDIASTSQLVSDEVINQSLKLNASHPLRAAVAVAESQASAQARHPTDLRIGDLAESYGQSEERWHNIATALRARLARTVTPFAGGIGVSDKQTRADDTTVVQPAFTRTIFMAGTTGSTQST